MKIDKYVEYNKTETTFTKKELLDYLQILKDDDILVIKTDCYYEANTVDFMSVHPDKDGRYVLVQIISRP